MKKAETFEKNITEGPIVSQLLSFFFPIVLGSFFQQFYNTVDAIIVGQFLGKQALAAVGGIGAIIVQLFVGFFVGLSAGCAVKVSQNFGAGHEEKLEKCIHSAIGFSALFGLVVSIVGFLIVPWLVVLTKVPADTAEGCTIYLRVYFLGMIGNMIYNMGAALLRALGDSRRPFYYLVITCFINIGLDLLFVLPLNMGIMGAALATILSQLISAILVLYALTRNSGACKLTIRRIRIDGTALNSMLRLGVAAGFQSTMYNISNLIVQSSVNTLGTNSAAGWAAYIRVDSIFWLVSTAFTTAIMTFVGQNYGARKNLRIKKGTRACLLMAVIAAVILSAIFLIFGKYILRIFTSDEGVIIKGMEVLAVFAPLYLTWVPIEIYSGSLRGMGETLPPFLITGFGVCLFRVIWIACITPKYLTIQNIALAYPLSWALTSLIYIVYYYGINKKSRLIYSRAKREEAELSRT